MPGPPPKPKAIRELEGDRSHRPPREPPEAVKGSPRRPGSLSGPGKAVWDRTTDQLSVMGVLEKIDRDALVVYCEAVVAMEQARDDWAEHGTRYMVAKKGRDGVTWEEPVQNPAWRTFREAAELVRKYGSVFGMSPADRMRLAGPEPSEDDELADLISLKVVN